MKFFCKFSTQITFLKDINKIQHLNNVKVTIYKEKTNLFLIYPYTDNINSFINTIILHKKEKTFFTINALNRLVDYHNNSIIQWNLYDNKLILIKEDKIHFIDIKYYTKL
jgi:hypothetical protein